MSEGTESPMTPQMKVNYYVVPWLLFGVDLLVILTSVYLSVRVTRYFGQLAFISQAWCVLLPILHVAAILMQDLYRGRRLFYDVARKLFKATCYTMVAGLIFDFVLHFGTLPTSRLFVFTYWTLSLLGLLAGRYVMQRVLRRLGVWQNRVIIIGAGKTAEQFSGRNDIAFDGRLQLDAWYVRNWSLWQDITLLVRTIGVVLGQKGAY